MGERLKVPNNRTVVYVLPSTWQHSIRGKCDLEVKEYHLVKHLIRVLISLCLIGGTCCINPRALNMPSLTIGNQTVLFILCEHFTQSANGSNSRLYIGTTSRKHVRTCTVTAKGIWSSPIYVEAT